MNKVNIAAQLRLYGEVKENEAMKHHTTFRIGGRVRYAFYPKGLEGLKQGIALAISHQIEYKVVGKGSNLLWSDDDLEVIVIFLDQYFSEYEFSESIVECDAGCSLIALSMKAMELGYSGLEFASGIPGSIGGAIFMNAGAYLCSMGDIVEQVLILREQEFVWMDAKDLLFGYRYSILKEHPAWVIVRARLRLTPKDPESIKEVVVSRRLRRQESQPLNLPSAGSIFKNPTTIPAWKCIEEVDLRGFQVGDVKVSEKHCNFLVNVGNATASDVLSLVELIQAKVFETMKVELVMEVEQYQCQRKKSH